MNRNVNIDDAATISSLVGNTELNGNALVEKYIADKQQVPNQPLPADHPAFGELLAAVKASNQLARALRHAVAPSRLSFSLGAADGNSGSVTSLARKVTDLPCVVTYLQVFGIPAAGAGNVYLYDADGLEPVFEQQIGPTYLGPFLLPAHGLFFRRNLYLAFDATVPATAYAKIQGWSLES